MQLKFFSQIIWIGTACLIISCGDIFNAKKKIFRNYYLVQGDTEKDLSICYKTKNDDFIGRVPGQILEYGIKDTFAKSKIADTIQYYIINIKKDSDYSKQKEYLVGIKSEQEFIGGWKTNLKSEFIKVE